MSRFQFAPILALAMIALCASTAQAESITYGFEQLTNNSGSNFSSDFDMTVTFDGTELTFAISNVVGGSGSVTDIYWHDTDELLSLTGVVLPTNWATPASPDGMKNATGFITRYSTDSDPPPVDNGIEGGETASFIFLVTSGTDWDDILSGLDSTNLMLGFHGQSLGTGADSEWFLNATPVPEPGTLLLMGSVLAAGALTRRRRRKAYGV